MAQKITLDIPLMLECLKVPVKWTYQQWSPSVPPEKYRIGELKDGEYFFTGKIQKGQKLEGYDPWEMRDAFFRLSEERDPEEICKFLNRVGLFYRADVQDVEEGNTIPRRFVFTHGGEDIWVRQEPPRELSYVFNQRALVRDALESKCYGDLDTTYSLQMMFDIGDPPQAILRALNFYDALTATAMIDVIRGAKFQKCKRPDCSIPFAVQGKRKRKYCSWYCGHLQSIRRKRRLSKREISAAKSIKKGRR